MRAVAAAGLAGAVLCVALVARSPAPAAAPEMIGQSVQGKPILVEQLGDPTSGRVALVVGVIHGNERAGLQVTRILRERFAGLVGAQIWVIDTVNPDGLAELTRKNARGVDLNRNFPYRWRGGHGGIFNPGPSPASEPETQAVMQFAQRIHPDVSIWYHQHLNAVLACPGPKSAAHYAKLVKMRTSCKWKRLHGTAISWEEHALPGAQAFVVELHGGSLSGAEANRHAHAAVQIARGG